MHKLHDWIKKVLWHRFWLDLCTKQVVNARACATIFCPVAHQLLHYLAWELCRQIAASILSRLTPLLLVWGVRSGGWGGRGILGRRPKFYTWLSLCFVCAGLFLCKHTRFDLLQRQTKAVMDTYCSLLLSMLTFLCADRLPPSLFTHCRDRRKLSDGQILSVRHTYLPLCLKSSLLSFCSIAGADASSGLGTQSPKLSGESGHNKGLVTVQQPEPGRSNEKLRRLDPNDLVRQQVRAGLQFFVLVLFIAVPWGELTNTWVVPGVPLYVRSMLNMTTPPSYTLPCA